MKRDQLLRLGGVLLLAALTLAVIGWIGGFYDVSFLKRPAGEAAETEQQTEPEDTAAPQEEPVQRGVRYYAGGSVNDVFRLALPDNATVHSASLQALLAAYPDGIITRRSLSLPDAYSYRDWAVRSVTKTVTDLQGHTSFSVDYNTEARPAVTLWGGFAVVSTADGCALYDTAGTLLLSDFDPDAYTMTNYDDGAGHVLLRGADGKTFRVADGALTEAVYDGIVNPWQLECELPLGYTGDGTTAVYTENGLFGYRAADGTKLTDAVYLCAFAHSGGYAIAYGEENVSILNAACEVVTTLPYETDDVTKTPAEVTVPQTFGAEYYGLNVVDHGLTLFRTRRNLNDAENYEALSYIKLSDDCRLYNLNGTQLPLPDGYTLLGYSDGMLLLRSDTKNRYGYMSYLGEWVVNPILTEATPFVQGYAAVKGADGKMGLIDTDGTVVLPLVFDYVSAVSRGCCAVYDAACGWQLLSLTESGAEA